MTLRTAATYPDDRSRGALGGNKRHCLRMARWIGDNSLPYRRQFLDRDGCWIAIRGYCKIRFGQRRAVGELGTPDRHVGGTARHVSCHATFRSPASSGNARSAAGTKPFMLLAFPSWRPALQ